MFKGYKLNHPLKGEIKIPGDKSISHRAIIIGSMAHGITEIENYSTCFDCKTTIECMRKLGVNIIKINDTRYKIYGNGYQNFIEPNDLLDVGNSGTTIRMLLGLLSGSKFTTTLTGDKSIRQRPLERIIKPLINMGAYILARNNNSRAPVTIKGNKLIPIDYEIPIASAQLKSALLLAGLQANGVSRIKEPLITRNHTELMLKQFGADININDKEIIINKTEKLKGQKIFIPGDISSASFLMGAASIIPGSELLIKSVGINPTRTGFLDILNEIGAHFEILNKIQENEVYADIKISYNNDLRPITIKEEIVPRLIDEIPIITVISTQINGITTIKGASELRVKETDRIKALTFELNKMGAKIEELPDGMIIYGKTKLHGNRVFSYNDHRIAMSLIIASLIAEGETIIDNIDCIKNSFPEFISYFDILS